jgi:hypothetical protein
LGGGENKVEVFHKRNNAAEDEGKEEALDPTQSVNGLGSKEDMLVIVVPSPRSSSLTSSRHRYASQHPSLSAVKNFSTAFSMLLKLMADHGFHLENSCQTQI